MGGPGVGEMGGYSSHNGRLLCLGTAGASGAPEGVGRDALVWGSLLVCVLTGGTIGAGRCIASWGEFASIANNAGGGGMENSRVGDVPGGARLARRVTIHDEESRSARNAGVVQLGVVIHAVRSA